MFNDNISIAFGLTAFAGLSTGVGSALAFFTHSTNTRFLAGALGFSAGVMLYVSFVEILAKARDSLIVPLGETWGTVAAVSGFFGGMILAALIDLLVPEAENPHEIHRVEDMDTPLPVLGAKESQLMRMGLFTALAIAIHNFPEGLATFTAALQDPSLGIPIAGAIAIHNIPEGIAVAVPIYYATGSRAKAFGYSFASGLAEPLGAGLGYFLFLQFFSELTFGVVFASVAGIMVFISLDELLPTAQEFGHHHTAIYGLMAGMAVMAASLLLFM